MVAATLLGVGCWLGYPRGVFHLALGVVLAIQGTYAFLRTPVKRSASLEFAGGLAGILGLFGLSVFWNDWREFATSDPQPQPIRLSQLLDQGYGDNRHVIVQGFAFCTPYVGAAIYPQKDVLHATPIWVPVVPANQRAPDAQGVQVATPRKVQVLLRTYDTIHYLHDGKPREGVELAEVDQKRRRQDWERKGWPGRVRNGLLALTTEEKQYLLKIAPDTDIDAVILIETGRPPEALLIYSVLGATIGLVAFGSILFVAVKFGTRRDKTIRATVAPPAPATGGDSHSR
jgi:hypothetical protein